ncbi:hypothetical protein BDR03DRAFT_1015054 [Suillus americanus]|nr:hypothetical protein BDR03DRAFT_1015054 [Suillus americanus]
MKVSFLEYPRTVSSVNQSSMVYIRWISYRTLNSDLCSVAYVRGTKKSNHQRRAKNYLRWARICQIIKLFGRLASPFHAALPFFELMTIHRILTRIVVPLTNLGPNYPIPPRATRCMPALHLLDTNLGLNSSFEPISQDSSSNPEPPMIPAIPVVFGTLNGKLLGRYLHFMAIGGVPLTEILKDVPRELSEEFTAYVRNISQQPAIVFESKDYKWRTLEQRQVSRNDHFAPATLMKGLGHRFLRSDTEENTNLF